MCLVPEQGKPTSRRTVPHYRQPLHNVGAHLASRQGSRGAPLVSHLGPDTDFREPGPAWAQGAAAAL